MRMITKLALMTLAPFVTILSAHAETIRINPSASQVTWMGSKVVGGSHTGSLAFKSGEIEYQNGKPTSAKLVVDISSLKNEDLKDADLNKKLVGHLLSEDFFNVAKFPTAQLLINKIEPMGGGTYDLTGELKILDATRPIKLKAIEKATSTGRSIRSEFKFDRTEFGLRYGSGKFFKNLGDKVISDEVSVSVSLELEPSRPTAQK
jgi:polyisoprenoid-binding protein YceI